jgi:hypothetical protein
MPALAIFYKKHLSIFGNLGDCCGREGFITGSIEVDLHQTKLAEPPKRREAIKSFAAIDEMLMLEILLTQELFPA